MRRLEDMTKRQLYLLAVELAIRGRSRMRKAELIRVIRERLKQASYPMSKPKAGTKEHKEPRLPEKPENEFVEVTPVNPELLFACWNAEGERGELKVFVNHREVATAQVELRHRRYYIRLGKAEDFGRAFVLLKTDRGKVLRSVTVTLPSASLHQAETASISIKELAGERAGWSGER